MLVLHEALSQVARENLRTASNLTFTVGSMHNNRHLRNHKVTLEPALDLNPMAEKSVLKGIDL